MEILIIVICLAVTAVLTAVEMSFVTVTRSRLRELSRLGHRDAARALVLRMNPERTLSVLQIGITLVATFAAAVGGVGVEGRVGPYLQSHYGLTLLESKIIAVALVVGPITYLTTVVGELVPKTLALRDPLRILLFSARTLAAVDRALSPIVSLLEFSTRKILSLLPFYEASSGEASEIVELGLLSRQTREYVVNLLSLEKRRIRDVQLPWEKAVFVTAHQSMAEVAAVVHESGHTRLPVLKEGEVVGILNSKEFFAFRESGQTDWLRILGPAVNVSDSLPILRALKLMQDNRSHLCVTYGGEYRTGIVTMEDILVEIIGDVFDEDDDQAPETVLNRAKTGS
jgi:putative hemolysin